MPIFKVIVLLGQLPQAPCSLTFTIGPSSSTTSTLPPSAIRKGRSSSSTFSTFSSVRAMVSVLIGMNQTSRPQGYGVAP